MTSVLPVMRPQFCQSCDFKFFRDQKAEATEVLVVVMIIEASGNDCGDSWLQMWRIAGYGYKCGGWLVMVMEAFYGTSWKAVMVLLVERAGNLFFCIL